MTSPIETNNVVERLREIGRAIRCGHVTTARALVDDWQFSPDATADLIQSLSDRIDVLEGENAALKHDLERVMERENALLNREHDS